MVKLKWLVSGFLLLTINPVDASLSNLNNDCKKLICFHLNESDLCRLAQTSREWNQISSLDQVWFDLAECYYSQNFDFYARYSKTANEILLEAEADFASQQVRLPAETVFGRLYEWLYTSISQQFRCLFTTRLGPRMTPYPYWKTFMKFRLQIAQDISQKTLTQGQFQALGLGRAEDDVKQFFMHQILNRSKIGHLFEANQGPGNWMLKGILNQFTNNITTRVETARNLSIIVSELQGAHLLSNEDIEIDESEYRGECKRRKLYDEDNADWI